jgi:hypothetical protein
MSGIYIKGMEMPKNCCQCPVNMEVCKRGYKYLLEHPELYDKRADDCPLVPVPEHERLLKVLKTERECVSRDCDRNCGKCDLSMERSEILSAYDALIAVLDAPTIIPADKEGEG